MRWSEEQLDIHLKAHQKRKNSTVAPRKEKSDARALGRLKQGVMNQTEQKYADHLEGLKILGEIAWFAFDSMKFRLADKTFYSPDFIVMKASGELEAHEVKGHWEDDARVKIKVAAGMFPIPFIAVKRNSKNNTWEFENF
ncbi:hypothetical protein [Acinetobacter colistiniresistens]|uniref:hypothetical protein n=1 Tax=Acinetobacter colistiniresistens TaxID=280145 RepID=UPI00124F93F7|nr:hypothetical protein [Acinetobacter colistiniresistens]